MILDINKFYIVFATAIALSLGGCASALKKQCQTTNWFDHGMDIAKRGARPDQDTLTQSCKKEEYHVAFGDLDRGFKKGMDEYCQPQYSRIVGQRGDFLNLDLCDAHLHADLTAKHKIGVTDYCKTENGYSAGSQGKPYNGICAGPAEAAFLPEFKRGRKNYLQTILAQKRDEISAQQAELNQSLRQQEQMRNQLSQLSTQMSITEAVMAKSGVNVETQNNQRARMQDERDDLRNSLSSLEWEASKTKKSIQSLREEARAIEQSITELGI